MSDSEHRGDKRFPFKWDVAVVFEGSANREMYRGVTLDVSIGGCAILTEHNVYSEKPVSVLISLPAENPTGKRKIVEAKARMVYTVLSAGHNKFRLGIQFTSFKEDGRAALNKAFAQRDIKM